MPENEIVNPNADVQESAQVSAVAEPEAAAATTNPPVEENTVPEAPQGEAKEPIKIEQLVTETPQATDGQPQPEEQSKPEPKVETPHDDFDWSIDKRNVSTYKKEERERYDSVYDNTFVQINDGEIINGNVVALTKTDVVVNIGFKSDGLVSLNEFRDISNLKVGDDVEVMVVEKEDRAGHLHLSRKSARIFRAWERIVEVHKTGEVITGIVTSKTKGGLIVDVFGMETFLPGSQIDVKPVTDYDQFVGKTMEFKVVKVNEAIKNAVVSHKALIESDIEAQRAEIMSKLE